MDFSDIFNNMYEISKKYSTIYTSEYSDGDKIKMNAYKNRYKTTLKCRIDREKYLNGVFKNEDMFLPRKVRTILHFLDD